MGGPSAGILFPAPLSDATKVAVREEIHRLTPSIEGDDFWIEGSPFILSFGFEYEEVTQEYEENRVPEIIGWMPRDKITFIAMCNDAHSHRVLAELCTHFSQKMGGLIDLCGSLTPLISDELKQLFHDEYILGKTFNWASWEPHVQNTFKDFPGKVYTVVYTPDRGGTCAYHICDVKFLEAWMRQPHFHMIK